MNIEQEFVKLTNQCFSRLKQKPVELAQVSADLYQAETCLRQLKIEAVCMPTYQKEETLAKCVKYLSDVNSIKRQIREIEQDRLFGKKIDEKVKTSSALLEKQGATLELGKKVSLESEAIAAHTMASLKNQRSQLMKTSSGAKEIGDNLQKSSKFISALQRRSITNKLIMICIIFLLAIAIILVAFHKFLA
jgi:6-phosphogluconate dehydrogenase